MYGEGGKEEKEEGREGERKKQEARSRTKIDDFLPSDRRTDKRADGPQSARDEEATIHSWPVEQTCLLESISMMIHDALKGDSRLTNFRNSA